MRYVRLTPKRAVWAGLLGTPVVLVGVLLVLMTGSASSAKLGKASAGDNGSYPSLQNTKSIADLKAYWTPQRMASARSVDAVATSAPAPTVAGASATGAPGLAGGYVKQSLVESGAVPNQASALGTTSTGVTPADGGYPGPNNTFEYFPKYRKWPVSTIGKLFFTIPGSGNFVCSAAATSGSANLNWVWTAGHCVANGGAATFYTNWLFCPSYDSSQGGENPAVGCWAWSLVSTSNEWFNSGAFTRDYGILRMQTTGDIIAAPVGSVTGTLGFAWNWSRDQHWMDFGYPAGSPWSGGKIVVTAAEHRYDDVPDVLGPPANSIGSGLTPGSSGGPWILQFSYTGGNFINSVNSYYYTNPNQYGIEMQGAYYDTQVCNFWKGWVAWPGTC